MLECECNKLNARKWMQNMSYGKWMPESEYKKVDARKRMQESGSKKSECKKVRARK